MMIASDNYYCNQQNYFSAKKMELVCFYPVLLTAELPRHV